jgi:signal peptidase II
LKAHWLRFSLLLCLGMGLLFLDFFTKSYVYHLMAYTLPLHVASFLGIDFSLDLALNRGMAWGLFPNLQSYLLILRLLVIAALLVYLFYFNQRRASQIPLVLIVSGAAGNIVDNFLYGLVVDFFHFNLWGYHFPIFNLADSFITIGVCLLLIQSLFKRRVGLTHAN